MKIWAVNNLKFGTKSVQNNNENKKKAAIIGSGTLGGTIAAMDFLSERAPFDFKTSDTFEKNNKDFDKYMDDLERIAKQNEKDANKSLDEFFPKVEKNTDEFIKDIKKGIKKRPR